MTAKQIRKIYGIVLSVALVAAGICLMWACWQVYTSGGSHPFHAQSVAKAFAPISIVVYLALALTLGSIVLHMCLPQEKEKHKVEKNYSLMLQKLHEKNDLDGCGDEKLVSAIYKEQKNRKMHKIICLIVLGICSAVFFCYALSSENVFVDEASQITGLIAKGAVFMLVCLVAPFGYGVFTAYYCKRSIRRELDLMKLVAAPRTEPLPAPKAKPGYMAYIPYAGALIAVVLIVLGALTGGWNDVLTKAVNICRECVGLG